MRGIGWLEVVHPDDRARAWRCGRRRRRASAPTRARCACARATAAIGISRPAACPSSPSDGTVREWIGTNTDITARKEAEIALREEQLRYQLATAAGGVGVWDLDLETGEMYIDPQLKAILGFEDHEIREPPRRLDPQGAPARPGAHEGRRRRATGAA